MTKIFATLGPATNTETILRKMFKAGLDGVRLNFSHGCEAEHLKRVRLVRDLNKKMGRAIQIMQDLEGNRIRVGLLKKPIPLLKHTQFYLTQENITGTAKEVSFDYPATLDKIKVGMHIYIDDGKLVLEVKGKGRRRLKVKVLVGGILKENKGINIPEANLDFPLLTEKDKRDVKVAVREKFEYVAQSFVRSAKDLKALRGAMGEKGARRKLYAKIENRLALKNIDEIIDEADGIMVARGDLGVSVPIYKVPVIQKEVIKMCILKKKPVMVATQMLDSMTEEPFPTRAEVSDVANAILDGATSLLLSGETSVGKYPDKAVGMMNKIDKNTIRYARRRKWCLG